MLHPVRLRDLEVTGEADGRTFVSAASGLVRIGGHFLVIADDSLFLARFPASGTAPGVEMRLVEGALPKDGPARKRAKPDFESLLRLPPTPSHPQGSLLAMGSGSRANRMRGVRLALGVSGSLGTPELLDLSPLFSAIASRLPEVNVEGAVAMGGRLILLNRANTANPFNALVEFPLSGVLAAMSGAGSLAEPGIRRIDLGRVSGVPFAFTDAARSGRDIIFSAVAEDTGNAYDDGPCIGSAIGILSPGGRLKALWPLADSPKVEGIAARTVRSGIEVTFVTDADDPHVPAALWRCRLPDMAS
jgi:hypothetical protein